MNNPRDLLKAYKELTAPAALATVVKTKGPSYRRAGARLLIREDRTTVGMISGGCLEHDVVEKALKIMKSGRPELAVFDMTGTDDEVWGYGQGCNGVISLLIEPLDTPKIPRHLQFLDRCLSTRMHGVLATIFRVDGEVKAAIGTHLMLGANDELEETIRHPVVTSALAEAARSLLSRRASATKEFKFTDGVVEAFLELVRPPVHLVIVGGGHDSPPVARIADELGWELTIVDHRPAYADKSRFPETAQMLLARPEELGTTIPCDDQTAVLIMTHNFEHDIALVRHFLAQGALPYIGLLGPKQRRDLLLRRLHDDGMSVSAAQLGRLFNPVGLDIGSDDPAEIALAAIAEIQAVLAHRAGGSMRDREGPLHPTA